MKINKFLKQHHLFRTVLGLVVAPLLFVSCASWDPSIEENEAYESTFVEGEARDVFISMTAPQGPCQYLKTVSTKIKTSYSILDTVEDATDLAKDSLRNKAIELGGNAVHVTEANSSEHYVANLKGRVLKCHPQVIAYTLKKNEDKKIN